MFRLCSVVLVAAIGVPAVAQDLVVIQGTDLNHYGSASWTQMTSLIDDTFASVSLVPALSAAALQNADALWVDHRGAFTALPQAEFNALMGFIASGRRVVFMGENVLWADWNRPVLEALGGGFVGGTVFANAMPTGASPELTAGVSGVQLTSAGIAQGGISLFDQNWATLWGENVLTLLDGDAFASPTFRDGNAAYAENVVDWLAVPGPAPVVAVTLGMLTVTRRRRD